MQCLLGIPYVNRPDLLALAVESVRAIWPYTQIIDNSPHGLPQKGWPVAVFRPSVPLTFSQTMNLLASLADETGSDVVLMMHNDAEAAAGTCERLLAAVQEAERTGRHWGIMFTQYDTLVAMKRSMMRYVGPWDTNLPQYFADNDYYRRVRLAGFEILETGLPVTHHQGSSATIRSDSGRSYLNGVTFPLYEQYYISKWGGRPGEEGFEWPFAGKLATAFVDDLRRQGLFQSLAASYDTVEGNLLERASDPTPAAQIETLRAELNWLGARKFLETGTNKCMFGYVLSRLVQDASLFTFDGDPRSARAVEILQTSQQEVRVQFTLGDTKSTLREFREPVDLAWIDGGHDLDTALSDVNQAMRLGARSILVDDTKSMPEVAVAVRQALDAHPEYQRVKTQLSQFDSRGVAVLRKLSAGCQ